jgi:hypothetical protein
LIQHFGALKDKATLILSNMLSGTKKKGNYTDDTYAAERQQIKADGVNVIDRFMPSNRMIGHNKFQVLVNAVRRLSCSVLPTALRMLFVPNE